MKFSADLDETDLALVNALQTAPRASWALVGRALGISPVTAARRWKRLTKAGLAWVTAYGGGFIARHHVEAFVEVDCVPSQLSSVVAGLVEQPQVASVEHTSGQQDLLLTVLVSDLAALSRLLTDVIGRLDGVLATRSQIVTELLTEGSRWDLRALDRDQRQIMHDGRDDLAVQEPDPTPAPEDIPLMLALGRDGRLGYQELAQRTGMGESTARRRTSRLLRAGVLVPRCEIAHSRSNYPVFVTYRMNVPSAALASGLRTVRGAGGADVRLDLLGAQPGGQRLGAVGAGQPTAGGVPGRAVPGDHIGRPVAHAGELQADGVDSGRRGPGGAPRPHRPVACACHNVRVAPLTAVTAAEPRWGRGPGGACTQPRARCASQHTGENE
ncbi:AsnC family transcriptional regulator [Streptomyces malaysiensis subsp. malaysiensis]